MDTEIINTLYRIHKNNKFPDFIEYIRFPRFKNIEPDTRINFDFPLTVFVGPNGCGKSSALHALYGAPGNNSVGRFWFSTKVDPIEEYGERNCFIYGFRVPVNEESVEVLKTRIRKGSDPDYWEPSRPLKKYGMKDMPSYMPEHKAWRSKTRWNAIKKDVVYIDFRAELSAFDKYFYFGELQQTKNIRTKQDYIRHRATYLSKVINNNLRSFPFYDKERIKFHRSLTAEELYGISYILGREYCGGIIIEHSLFKNLGLSVIFETQHSKYSEAFAGSGEMAVAALVVRMLSAENGSLILLDEPEVSLHPGAQARLKHFLLEQAKEKKHQVIISTHSPSIIDGLPKKAIKVFTLNPQTGHFSVKSGAYVEEAFYYLGQPMTGEKTILVEDRLAKSLIEYVLDDIGKGIGKTVKVKYYPGGADTLIKHYIPVYCQEGRPGVKVLLDGDKKKVNSHVDPDSLSPNEHEQIDHLIKEQTGVRVDFYTDSNGEDTLKKLKLKFLGFYKASVKYIPCETPEEFIWKNSTASIMKNIVIAGDGDYKKVFHDLAVEQLGIANPSGDEIYVIQKQCLAKVNKFSGDYIELKKLVEELLE